jgi:guanyl-specific ribonuclease Sa
LLLLLAFALLFSTPVRTWLTTADDLPTLAQMFSFLRKEKRNVLPKAGKNLRVWAKKQSGFYYCQGGILFGNKPGKMMAQVDALMAGFRPSDGDYCSSGQQMAASSDNPPLENQQQTNQADVSRQQDGSLVRIVTQPPDISKAEGRIRVWAVKEFGSYYCRGEILFGDKPGKLMTQSDALRAGYHSSEGRCTNDKPGVAVADNLSLRSQQPTASAQVPPHEVEPLALISKKPPKVSKAEGGAKVWVKTKFGFYYCQNDVLFGNKPGRLMTQFDALTAGYHPSDGRCSNAKPTRAAAESLPPRAFPETK